MQEMWVWSVGREDPLEKKIATHSSIRAWEIWWTEEPDGLQSTRLQRAGLDSGTEDTQQGSQIYWVEVFTFSGFPGDVYTQSSLPALASASLPQERVPALVTWPRSGACAGQCCRCGPWEPKTAVRLGPQFGLHVSCAMPYFHGLL